MQGSIVQINISPGGLPKRAIAGAGITPLGLTGDGHAHPEIHGGPNKAVLIIAAEVVDELRAAGHPVFYGALGENLTTRGLAVGQLRIGHQLRAGGAVLEVVSPRHPCSQLDVYGAGIQQKIFDPRVKARDDSSPQWGRSGLYCRVITPGPVHTGDPISVLAALA